MSMGHKFDDIIVVGDFNIPGAVWDDPINSGHTTASRVVLAAS